MLEEFFLTTGIRFIYRLWEKLAKKFKIKRGKLIHVIFEEEYAEEFYSFIPFVDIIKYRDDLLQIRDAWIMFKGDKNPFGKKETTTYKYSLNRDSITPKEIKHSEEVSFGHVWLPQNLSEIVESKDVHLFFKDGKDKEHSYCFEKENLSSLRRWFSTRQIKNSDYIVHIICGTEITRDHRGRIIDNKPSLFFTNPRKRGDVPVKEFASNPLPVSMIQPSDSTTNIDEVLPLEIIKYRYCPEDPNFFLFFVKNYHPHQAAVTDRGVLQYGDEHFELRGNYYSTVIKYKHKISSTKDFEDIHHAMSVLGLKELPIEAAIKFAGKKEILEGEKPAPYYANNGIIPFGQTFWVVMKIRDKKGKELLGKSVKVVLKNGGMPVSRPFEFLVGTEKELIEKHTTKISFSPFVL
ncbi:MAG: hypothetical protein JW885_10740 [Deltaproteobacteria bacterium]|nr:hypothetical protein [Candidatus Zymogenaceae bacterium]